MTSTTSSESAIELPMGVTLIAAIGTNGQIGFRDELPWPKDRDDMRWFRSVTMASDVCIVGHNTWKTLPPLPGRAILRDDKRYTCKEFLDFYKFNPDTDRICIIGGAKTYARWLDCTRTILITKINYTGPADTFMPPLWKEPVD